MVVIHTILLVAATVFLAASWASDRLVWRSDVERQHTLAIMASLVMIIASNAVGLMVGIWG